MRAVLLRHGLELIVAIAISVVASVFVVSLLSGERTSLEFSSLTTLRSVKTDGDGVILTTTYDPIAIVVPIALAMTGLASLWLAVWRWWGSGGAAGGSGSFTAKGVAAAGQGLERELTNVLAAVRTHIGSSDTYAESLSRAQSRLASLDEAKQVRVVVSLLLAENERRRLDTSDLKGKLEASQAQIEALRASLRQAEEVGLQDTLTSIGNRRCFDEALKKEIAEAKGKGTALSLVMCDIDNFKQVNDTFGHTVGDEVLKMFARLFSDNVRDGDTVARFGGEEFGIILPRTSQASAIKLAERVRLQCATRELTLRNSTQKIGKVTASFGIVQYRDGDGAEALLSRVDAKLYEAKGTGRNRVASDDRGDV